MRPSYISALYCGTSPDDLPTGSFSYFLVSTVLDPLILCFGFIYPLHLRSNIHWYMLDIVPSAIYIQCLVLTTTYKTDDAVSILQKKRLRLSKLRNLFPCWLTHWWQNKDLNPYLCFRHSIIPLNFNLYLLLHMQNEKSNPHPNCLISLL